MATPDRIEQAKKRKDATAGKRIDNSISSLENAVTSLIDALVFLHPDKEQPIKDFVKEIGGIVVRVGKTFDSELTCYKYNNRLANEEEE